MFSDRHAYLQAAQFYANLADLDRIDWAILQSRNFKRDPEDMDRVERYQAEALVHLHISVQSLMGIVCYDAAGKKGLDVLLSERDMRLKIVTKPGWYF